MTNQHVLKADCPYCGNANAYLVDSDNLWGLHAMYCDDPDTGGCERVFAIEWKFMPEVKTYKCKQVDAAEDRPTS